MNTSLTYLRYTRRATLLSALLFPIAALAAHPLATEDTGVQGQNNWQFELNTDRAVERETKFKSLALNATLTFGLTDAIDLGVNLPWLRNQTSDAPREYQRGVGDATAFIKWRLYEADKLSLALKPVIYFATGDANKGLDNDRTRPGVTGVASWGDDKLSLSGNLGYTYNDNKAGDRKGIWSTSAAVMASLGENLRGVAEIGTYTNSDADSHKRPAFANIGLIYSPNDKLDLDLGYKRGLNKAECQHSVGAGVTVRW